MDFFPQDPPWLKQNTILLANTGSHAYGTNTETSDMDYKGVCIPPASYFLGLDSFSGYDKSGGKAHKNMAGDVDLTVVHINKFVQDAFAGVPNNLELLFIEEENYLLLTEAGHDLIGMRHEFLSKRIMQKFGGYAKSQAMKMENLKSNGAARQDLVDKYGFDTKFYMHTVRLLYMAIEILETHDLKTKRPEADFLIALRNGYHNLEDALTYIATLEKKLGESYEESTLRAEPDYDKINRWLVEFNRRYMK